MDLSNLLWYLLLYPGTGDPSLVGRMTVVAYLGVAMLCLACGFGIPIQRRKIQPRRFWFALAWMLFLLGIVKQFNLASGLTETLSKVAWQGGWYGSRRIVQLAAILIGLLLLALAVFALLKYRWPIQPMVWIGIGYLLFLVFARATSLHDIDLWLNWQPAGVKVNWILEYAGIGCIGMASVLTICLHRRDKLVHLIGKETIVS
jgi:hypothetical protein